MNNKNDVDNKKEKTIEALKLIKEILEEIQF